MRKLTYDEVIALFEANIDKTSPCWKWLSSKKVIHFNGGTYTPLKFAWIVANGEAPKSHLRRVCGDGMCINPAHARLRQDAISLGERFWAHVIKSDGCWEWGAATSPSGYGIIRVRGRNKHAHRVAYELANEEPPGDLFVCHKCDNPLCVRPDHLFLGSAADNSHDMREKGRGVAPPVYYGSKNPSAKLREADVRAIRQRYAAGGVTKYRLAKEYGVDNALIARIIARTIWKEVD